MGRLNRPLGLLLLVTSLMVAGIATEARSGASDSRIKKILAERVDTAKQAVGIVAGVVDASGVTIVAHGRMGVDDGRPVDGDTLFEIGSVSKLFAALLLAEMVERGEVGLEDPVPDVSRTSGTPMTLLHLARHTSGLPREPGNYAGAERYAPDTSYTTDQLFAFVKECRLESEPGKRYLYSNLGFGLLGHLLARRAGQDYDALVRERILAPLEMNSTAIHLSSEQSQRAARGHLLDRSPVASYILEGIEAAGAFKSSAKDMAQFVKSNLGLTRTSLWPAINRTQLGRRDLGIVDDSKRLAWAVSQSFDSEILSHQGKTWGYRAFLAIDRHAGRGVIVLSNSQHDIGDIGWHLLDKRNKLSRF